jgi:hypothetical protein
VLTPSSRKGLFTRSLLLDKGDKVKARCGLMGEVLANRWDGRYLTRNMLGHWNDDVLIADLVEGVVVIWRAVEVSWSCSYTNKVLKQQWTN